MDSQGNFVVYVRVYEMNNLFDVKRNIEMLL